MREREREHPGLAEEGYFYSMQWSKEIERWETRLSMEEEGYDISHQSPLTRKHCSPSVVRLAMKYSQPSHMRERERERERSTPAWQWQRQRATSTAYNEAKRWEMGDQVVNGRGRIWYFSPVTTMAPLTRRHGSPSVVRLAMKFSQPSLINLKDNHGLDWKTFRSLHRTIFFITCLQSWVLRNFPFWRESLIFQIFLNFGCYLVFFCCYFEGKI